MEERKKEGGKLGCKVGKYAWMGKRGRGRIATAMGRGE